MSEQTCTACKILKPLSEFYKRQNDPPLYKTHCKECFNERRKDYQKSDKGRDIQRRSYKKWRAGNIELARKLSREGNRKARAEDPRRFKSYELKARYGISLEEYEAILEKQNTGCAICAAKEPGGVGMFHVDHCHNSSKVRGLLCSECNMGLGKFKDSAALLTLALNYLTQT